MLRQKGLEDLGEHGRPQGTIKVTVKSVRKGRSRSRP